MYDGFAVLVSCDVCVVCVVVVDIYEAYIMALVSGIDDRLTNLICSSLKEWENA